MSETVTIVAGNMVVTGAITRRSNRFIEVTLTAPFTNLSLSSTVPMIACGVINLRGEEGDRTAHALLVRLHRQAVEMTARREELMARWRETERELQLVDDSDPGVENRLRPLRLDLRRQFKGGTLNQRQYQRELRKLKQLSHAYEQRRWAILSEFRKDEQWGVGLDLDVILTFLRHK